MGPCAGLLLADLGADVVKVEPKDGDATRRLPGFAAGFFASYNRNKRSIALDLKRPEGQTALRRLAAKSDILLENFAPGTIERLGCGWADLEKINPRLIYLSLKGYLAGPYENRGALDEVVQMQTGLAYMTGPPGQPVAHGRADHRYPGRRVWYRGGPGGAARARPKRAWPARKQRLVRKRGLFGWYAHRRQRRDGPADAADAGSQRRLGNLRCLQYLGSQQVFVAVTSDGHWQRFCEKFGFTISPATRAGENAARSSQREWLIPDLAKGWRSCRS